MAYLFNGATHVISRGDAIVQTWPITLHGRIRLSNSGDGLTHNILYLSEAASHNGFRILVELNTGTMKARCGTRAGGVAANGTTTTSISDSNWHSVIGEITSATARQVWLDNAGNGSNATSLTPSTLTKTVIGAQDSGGSLSGNVGHDLADLAIWSGTLTADERASLAAGVSPLLIRPDILEIYLPLMRGATDYMGSGFTVTAATVSDHPLVYMPARVAIAPKAGSVTGPIGTSIETDTALSLVPVQIEATGAAVETDTALALSSSRPAGLATETDSALALTSGASAPVGQATETDTAIALAGVSIRAAGLSVETDSALSLGGVAILAVGVAASGETSLPLGSARPAATASENETALGLSPVAIRQCGTALEGDAALALLAVYLRLVGASTETDAALALSFGASSAVGRADETDMALALQASAGPTPPDRTVTSTRLRYIVGNARGTRAIVSPPRKRAA